MDKLYRSRKLKYGATAAAFTAVVIAVVVLLNVVVTALAERYLWYVEMDKEDALFGLTDGTKALFDELSEKHRDDLDVKIIFCTPFDRMKENLETYRIYACAQSFADEYDFIELEYLDTITYPERANRYKTTANTPITEKSIIIENGSSFRVYSMEAMYTMAQSTGRVFAFNGEYKIATCILQLMGNNPIAYFTTGHGEEVETSGLYKLFEDAGYDVKLIDLTKEDIDPDAKVLVINNPTYDFLGADDSVNETKKVSSFLGDFGNLWVFLNPNKGVLKNLEELLGDWGIHFGDAVIKDYSNSLSSDGTELVAVYSEDETLGASLHYTIRELESIPKAVVSYARPIFYEEKFSNAYGGVDTSTVLYSSSEAKAYAVDDGGTGRSTGESDAEKTEYGAGPYNLMTLTREMRIIDNENYTSYILAAGTSQFVEDKYLNGNTYGNSDILFAAMQACGKSTVPADIDFRVLEDNSLNITTKQAYTLTVIFSAIIPAAVLVAGAAVYIRRRFL